MAKIDLGQLARKFNKALPPFDKNFFASAGEAESINLEISELDDTTEGQLSLADKKAEIAERAGESERFKKFVPAEARTKEARAALKK